MAEKLGLGYGFTKKACFVCESFSHLIRDRDFHEKRMAKQAELNNRMRKWSSQREIRPVWNNVQKVNHQNQFVPKAVLTRTGKIQVNTVKPIVNNVRPKAGFHKSVSPFRKSFNRTTALRTNFTKQKVNTAEVNAVSAARGKRETTIKPLAGCNWRPKTHYWNKVSKYNGGSSPRNCATFKDPLGRPKHMTGNKAYLAEYQDFNGGPVAFGGSKGYIIGKGKIKTGKLDFEDLPDENHVLLKIPRQNNMYSFNLENIVPSRGLACLIAKATINESNKWHRRLGHVNFKNLNKLVKGNLVRGLPSKIFQNDHTCVACQKGKQHKASCKAKSVSSISQPLQLLHMDLFGPTSVRSLNHKTYCLVITDDFSSKAFRVYNLETKRVEENLHINFLENKPNVARKGPTWLFDLDYLTDSINYQPVRSENQANKHASTKEANHNVGIEDNIDAGDSNIEAESAQDYFVLPIWSSYTSTVKSSKAMNAGENPNKNHDLKTDEKPIDNEDQVFLDELKSQEKDANDAVEALRKEFAQDTEDLLLQAGAAKASSTNTVNTASTPVSTANSDQDDSEIPALEEIYDNPTAGIFTNASYDDEGAVADFTNLETIMNASPIPTSRINSIHPSTLILGDQKSSSSNKEAKKCQLEQNRFTRNKKEEKKVVVVRNKAKDRSHRIFLAFASYMGFIVYQMDVKSAFSYDKIDEEVYVDDIIFGSTKRSWCDEFETLMKSRFQMSSMGELTFFLGLQVKQKVDGIFISQDKYVAEILKKFDFASVKTASTPIETQKPLVKDEEASDVDVHLYRSMIGSLMYLTASRPDIMFAVCACSSDICWKKNLDRKSTTGGCQFLGRRLISWQCKKQTIVATSTTEAEYVAAANCCGQVLWIQNQMLDYGFNFMNTKIYIDNESTICIVKNLVFHSKTKHIAIRHHFIRDAYEKKLIQVLKIHTDDNVADLLTKAFDVSIFQFLVVTIRMINP
ncbi:ribonuclease H-like domain-containing protein [Tanacetum coccineum]